MSRFFKIAGIVLGIIIVISVIAATLFVTMVNPNNFKNRISAAVYKNTGRQLTINGDISWSVFPHPGLRLRQVTLNNSPGFNQPIFAQIGELNISMRILPLFKGQLNFDTIILQNATFNLLRNVQGKANWENLLSPKTAVADPTPISPVPVTNKKVAFTISAVIVNNATVTWQNQGDGQSAKLGQLQLQSRNIHLNRPFPLQIQFVLNSNQPAVRLQITATSNVILNPKQNYYVLKELSVHGQLLGKNYAGGQLPFRLSTEAATVNSQQQTLQLNNIVGQIANLPLTGHLSAQSLEHPALEGKFEISLFDPQQFLTALGQNIRFAHENVMRNATVAFILQCSGNTLQLQNIHARLDDMELDGAITVTHPAETHVNADLILNQLYPDRYLLLATAPPPTTTPPPAAPVATESNSPLVGLFAAIPPKTIVAGSLRIGQFRLQNTTLTNVNVQYALQHELIKLAPITADLYQGKSLMQFIADNHSATPHLTLNTVFTNVQAGPFLKDLANKSTTQLTGASNITANLQTEGKSKNLWLNNLNGNVHFSVTNGVITNIDLGKEIYKVLQLIIKSGAPTQAETTQTPFNSLTGSVKIEEGVANNNDLLLQSNSLRVSGHGTANLHNQQLDYHLNATALGSPFGSDVLDVQKKLGGHIPIKVSGTFNDLKIMPDIQSATTEHLEEQVQKVLGKDLGNTLKKLNDFLGGH